jgi:hypothetical protein
MVRITKIFQRICEANKEKEMIEMTIMRPKRKEHMKIKEAQRTRLECKQMPAS